MNYLNEAYKTLKMIGLVSSLDEYSLKYLKKCESYARSYRARNKDLTLSAMVILTAQLNITAMKLSKTNAGSIAENDLKQLASELSIATYEKALESS